MNLPHEKTEEDIKEYFEAFTEKEEWPVAKVNFCFDIRDIVEKVRQLEKWNKIRNYNEHRANEMVEEKHIPLDEAINKIKNYEKAQEKAKKIAEEIELMKKDIESKDKKEYYINKAFVTFQYQNVAEKVTRKFKLFWFLKIFVFIWHNVFRCKRKINKRYWEGKRLVIERATEPGDVYWENLSVSDIERYCRQALTYLITAICLGVAFAIYYGLNQLGNYLEEEAESEGASSYQLWLLRLVNLVSSIITMVINILLDIVIRRLSSFEKHRSYTNYHLSVAIKLMTSTFINSALLPFFNNIEKEDWFTNNGLAMTIFYNTISVSFVSTLLYFFNFGYFIKKLRI